MNPILKDELVRRYFRCHVKEYAPLDHDCDEATALRVLDAMTAKINEGDKFLSLINVSDGAKLGTADDVWTIVVHPLYLRLPDAHQEPDYEKELEDRARHYEWCACEHKELIDLARKAERQKMERERR